MNNLVPGVENIFAANGPAIAIMGMLIVFAALAFISLFISQLPKLLPMLSNMFPEAHHHSEPAPSQPADHDKVLVAIAHALFHREAGSLPAK